MPQWTDRARLADLLLEEGLEAFLRSGRGLQPRPRSYARLARDLYVRSNGDIDVTAETVRAWCELLDSDPAPAPTKAAS